MKDAEHHQPQEESKSKPQLSSISHAAGAWGVERQALRQAMRSAAQLGSPGWDPGLGSDRDAGAAVEAQLCPGAPGSDLHCIRACLWLEESPADGRALGLLAS